MPSTISSHCGAYAGPSSKHPLAFALRSLLKPTRPSAWSAYLPCKVGAGNSSMCTTEHHSAAGGEGTFPLCRPDATSLSLLIVYVKALLEIRPELFLLLALFFEELPPLFKGPFCFPEHRLAVGLELFRRITREGVPPELHLLFDRPQKSLVCF